MWAHLLRMARLAGDWLLFGETAPAPKLHRAAPRRRPRGTGTAAVKRAALKKRNKG